MLDCIVHHKVRFIIRLANVRTISKSAYPQIAIEGRTEVFMVHLQGVVGVVLAATVVPIGAGGSASTFKFILLHEVRILHVQVVFLVGAHMLQEICQFTLDWVDAHAHLLLVKSL